MAEADPILNESGMTELQLAAYHGDFEWAQNCIAGGLDVNYQGKTGMTPLHWVVDMGAAWPDTPDRERLILLLLEWGADLDALTSHGESVFFRAIDAGNLQLAQLLIDNGADFQSPDAAGLTPYQWAVSNENLEVVELIERARKVRSQA